MITYLVGFGAFLIIGVPVALALGLGTLVYLVAMGKTGLLLAFPQRMIVGVDQFVYLTIPFFILTGNLMNASHLTAEIVRFAQMAIGRVRGGLAGVNVLANLMLSGPSGSATAEAAALGSVLIPAMKRDGYDVNYAAALTAVGSLLGPLIPPSLSMILYGVLSGTSIADLFLAGIGPGILLTAGLLIYVFWKARRENHPLPPTLTSAEKRQASIRAMPALFLPVIIVVGIRSGIFTPTEAAAIGALYALVIGMFLYRTLSMGELWKCLFDTATMSAGIMLVVATATMTAFVLGIEGIPAQIAGALLSVTHDPALLLILLNCILLILGLFLEPLSAMILIMPVLMQVLDITGLDKVQFGVMVILNLMVGMVTPPVGLCLFIVGTIGNTSVEKVAWAAVPMILICLVVLALVAFVPAVSLFIPNLVSG
jgi:tripartite ATP-independent transporter DctM subunit